MTPARVEELISSAFAEAPVGMLISTLDGRVVEANRAFCLALGYSRDEMLGRSSLDVWHRSIDRVAMLDRLRSTGVIHKQSIDARHQSGAHVELEATIQLLQIDEQPHLFSIIHDVTERNRVDARGRENERRFNEIARSIREVFWLTSLDKRQMLYVSPSYEEIWGDTCDNLTRSPGRWLDAIHPEDQARIRATAATQTVEPYDVEYRVIRPDGAIRWIHDRASVVRDDAGRPTALAGVAEDVTERRVLRLEFERAQRMESIGQLAGGVAHDFNNLLTVIATSAHCLRDELTRPAPDCEELISEIEQAVQRATGLTRQLLAFSRKEVVEPVSLELNELVASTEQMLRRLLGEDIQVNTCLAPGLGRTFADPGQLTQVVLNLAVNARDAMPKGGRLVIETSAATLFPADLRRYPHAKPGDYVRLSVTDTGEGMSPDVQARIFEPFFTTKPQGKGTGLGLAVVFGVVEQAGGLIEVVSAPGSGSTFHVYLPQCRDEAAGPVAPPKPEALVGNETLLLVEDDEAVRRGAARALKEHGYRVLEAADAWAAIEALRSNRGQVGLMIADVVMPGLDGRRLAEAAGRECPGLKTLFVSGYTDDAVMRYGVSQAEVDFLHKPFTPTSLAQKVRQVLDAPLRPRPD